MPSIRIIRPAGREKDTALLNSSILHLEARGFKVLFEDTKPDSRWPYTSSGFNSRLQELKNAVFEKDSDIILCARGGYGCSDLLPYLPWDEILNLKPKVLIGFSDISALLVAFHQNAGWPCIHGPMPATSVWNPSQGSFTERLINLMQNSKECRFSGNLKIREFGTAGSSIGIDRIYGGNLAVMSNLIGTPFLKPFPNSSFLFFEDINENPGRVLRYLNQWHQSGLFDNISGLLLGRFTIDGEANRDYEDMLHEQVNDRFSIPLFLTEELGHIEANCPIALGAKVKINSGELEWYLP